ncbi:hypothetical protein, conserved [Eimeria tenella]|uniref:Uncharacterized protein n=1 Tax=Eimeria tenella TaxID=5802 RepID=U6KIX2_EIMTE|nr:hypothetical protein, conserved [Eimeria tenella]CDJ37975.1 hypothetical protein, conserved [Eimeria tenella]|eukprot:XP_013228813.1 hypothetical protein, conserved [Eimeria tenella]
MSLLLSGFARAGAPLKAAKTLGALGASVRPFGSYQGQKVTSDQLLKKNDEWLIEETNFCLGRVVPVRFKETDDLAHRVLHLMDAQLGKMHTRLRDGTCIPVMGLYIPCIMDKPTPLHQCLETPLLKYTWDETYTEAFDN